MSNLTALRDRKTRNKDANVATLDPRDPRDFGPDSRAKQHSVTLPIWLWKKIERVAEERHYTRNQAIREILKQWIDDEEAKQLKKAK